VVEEGIPFNPSSKMTHDSDLKLLNPVSSGFQALKKGISTMGFCTEHLLYIRYMRGIRLLPIHFGCLGTARPGGDLARRMGVSGG